MTGFRSNLTTSSEEDIPAGKMNFGAIPGLLGVSSDGARFRGFIYGSPETDDEIKLAEYPLSIHLSRQSGRLFDPSENDSEFMDFGRYSMSQERQEVRYSRKFPFSRYGQWIFRRRDSGFDLIFNSTYARYSELVMTMHPVPDLLASIFSYYLLLENDFLSLHCSAVNFEGEKTAAIFALPNTGKTQTSYKLVTENGAKLVAEDITVYGRDRLYPCPFTRSGAYFLTKKTISRPFWTKRAYADRLFDHLDDKLVCLSGPVAPPSTIFILKPGQQPGTRRLSSDEAFSMVYGLNSAEFEGIARHSLLDIVGASGWPDLSVVDLKRHELTRALIDGCGGELFELTAPDSEGFAALTRSG